MKLIDPKKLVDVVEGAKYLLGCEIVRTLENGEVLRVKIVETESYHQKDPASHTFRGKSERNRAMFGPAAHAYIYFTYGMHWCFNVTAGEEGHGAGILIRAAQPLVGIDSMKRNRHLHARSAQNEKILHNIANGPAKLAQALAISKDLYGHNLTKAPLQILESEDINFNITETTRIGISQAKNEIARFYIADNRFVSKK